MAKKKKKAKGYFGSRWSLSQGRQALTRILMAIRFPGQPSLAGCQQWQKSQVVKMVSKIRKKGKKSRRILFLLNTLSACPVDA
jgi:hypothetical protein